MADDIRLVIGAEFRDLTKLAKTSEQLRSVLKAAAKEFSRTNDQSKYMKSLNAIVAAEDRLTKSSTSSRTALSQLGMKVVQETKFTDQLALATKRLTVAQTSSTKAMGATRNKMNGTNMAIQQAGYQFGDFAVQVQGGTSAFVAFSQQGAQLAGILPSISGPLGISTSMAVGLSAAFGVLIPVGSALGRMFFEMSGKAKTLEDAMSDMEGSLSDFESNMEKLDDYDLELLNGSLSEMDTLMRSLASSSSILAEKMANLAAIDAVSKIGLDVGFWKLFGAEIGSSFDSFFVYMSQAERKAANIAKVQAGMLDDFGFDEGLDVEKYKNLLDRIEKGLESEDSLAVVQAIEELTKAAVANEADVSADGRERLGTLIQIAETQYAIIEAEERAGALAEKANAKKIASALKINDAAREELRLQNQAIQLQEVERRAGKESLEYTQLAGVIDRENLALAMKKAGVEQGIIDDIMSGNLELQRGEELLASQATEAENLATALKSAESSMASLSSFGDGLQTTLEVTRAKVEALRAGTSEAIAGQIVAMRIALAARIQDARDNDNSVSEVDTIQGVGLMNINAIETLLKEGELLRDANKKSKRNSSKKTVEDYLDQLQKEQAHKSTLVGLTKEEIAASNFEFNLRKKISTLEGKTTNERLESIIETEIATSKLKVAEEELRSQMDMVSGHIESAFMAMVDGSKSVEDAFKSMLRNIILDIYQQQIAEPAATAVGGFLKDLLFSANGNVFSGGSQVKAYANGGVVNGPTTFPMSGGQTGLMGEAGPEAIMPLKRGANGKLGVQAEGGRSGDVININQSFNFQANGDDTVKKLIAQAAPKIADMAKASVIDSRRRGGSTKAAFG